MSENIDLKNVLFSEKPGKNTNQQAKEMIRDMLKDGDIDRERLEVLGDVLSGSGVKFSSVADKVNVDFKKFARMVQMHNLKDLLNQQEKDSKNPSCVIVPSDLLTEISNCTLLEEENPINVLSGIFIFGLFIGIMMSVAAAIIIMFVNVQISIRDLLLVLFGFLCIIFLYSILVSFEPYLKKMQQKHNETFQRVIGFFTNSNRTK